jgi:hypothetical protein
MAKDNIEQKQILIDLMNMEKQTAVEYLIKGLPMVYWEDPYYSDLLEHAKELEKQQIIDAYAIGYIDGVAQNKITAEQYYNETFKK